MNKGFGVLITNQLLYRLSYASMFVKMPLWRGFDRTSLCAAET